MFLEPLKNQIEKFIEEDLEKELEARSEAKAKALLEEKLKELKKDGTIPSTKLETLKKIRDDLEEYKSEIHEIIHSLGDLGDAIDNTQSDVSEIPYTYLNEVEENCDNITDDLNGYKRQCDDYSSELSDIAGDLNDIIETLEKIFEVKKEGNDDGEHEED